MVPIAQHQPAVVAEETDTGLIDKGRPVVARATNLAMVEAASARVVAEAIPAPGEESRAAVTGERQAVAIEETANAAVAVRTLPRLLEARPALPVRKRLVLFVGEDVPAPGEVGVVRTQKQGGVRVNEKGVVALLVKAVARLDADLAAVMIGESLVILNEKSHALLEEDTLVLPGEGSLVVLREQILVVEAEDVGPAVDEVILVILGEKALVVLNAEGPVLRGH